MNNINNIFIILHINNIFILKAVWAEGQVFGLKKVEQPKTRTFHAVFKDVPLWKSRCIKTSLFLVIKRLCPHINTTFHSR